MTSQNASFAEQYLSASFQPPISHGQVRRLALEGGGGKGNAYVGALCALEQLGVLDRLETVAGSSAGAITAMALSLGMRPPDVFAFMTSTDFSKFFDQHSDAIPTPGRPYDRTPPSQRASRLIAAATWDQVITPAAYAGRVVRALRKAAEGAGSTVVSALLGALYRLEDVTYALAALSAGGIGPLRPAGIPARFPSSGMGSLPPSPPPLTDRVVDQLLASLPDYLTSLSLDMGVFSGEVARDRLARLITERIAGNVDLATGSSRVGAAVDGRTLTFAQLDSFCSAKKYPLLRVTGSELCSLRTVIFSGRTTPNFPVADAVRISMGLPFVYKPYSIKSTGTGLPPCGVYVDGGVFSNLPLLAYSDAEAAEAIGLRLEIDAPTRIDGFLGLVGQLAKASLLAGESSVTADRAERSIRLDTEPLGLFDFSTDQSTLEKVSARAHLTTMLFFGQGDRFAPVNLRSGEVLPAALAAPAIRDTWDDLRASVERRRAAAGCVFET
ncbi:patatin-like phospholipase family protein [Streptomyces phaeochromogenes]|uniref:patatin-like phospholipase family protein n=1 Tax=Streptomyces phaeochromogenes TaxID=1923 RepID=UPI00386EB53C|nr:patatin-like phospholipase family protein [Streptomyces phaeochromogenes]